LNINVANTGENAYDTKCFIQLPPGVEYVSSNSSSIVRSSAFEIEFYFGFDFKRQICIVIW